MRASETFAADRSALAVCPRAHRTFARPGDTQHALYSITNAGRREDTTYMQMAHRLVARRVLRRVFVKSIRGARPRFCGGYPRSCPRRHSPPSILYPGAVRYVCRVRGQGHGPCTSTIWIPEANCWKGEVNRWAYFVMVGESGGERTLVVLRGRRSSNFGYEY